MKAMMSMGTSFILVLEEVTSKQERSFSYPVGTRKLHPFELLLHNHGFMPENNLYDVEFLAWNNANENKMTSYWSNCLQQVKEQVHLPDVMPSPNNATEETALRFCIQMKGAYKEYKTLLKNGIA
jgi:hypothetical protein